MKKHITVIRKHVAKHQLQFGIFSIIIIGTVAIFFGFVSLAATRPNPPIITKTCSPSGTYVRFEFTTPGATLYYPRLNTIPATIEQAQNDRIYSFIYYKIIPGKDYKFWVHAGNGGSSWTTDISYPGEMYFNCPAPISNLAPTISVTTTANSISSLGTFNITMTSTNALSCTWSRSGTYSGNWTDTSLGATSYNKTISGLAGPGNVTYSFTCKNSAGVTATGSATVTVTGISIRPNPPVITKTCNSSGTSVRLDYATPGATLYYPRLNTIPATVEQVLDNQTASFINYNIIPGKDYRFWVHAGNGGSNWSTDISGGSEVNINCPAPISNLAPTISVTTTANSISSLGTFNITMTSTNALSCTWSRSGTYSGNWTDTSLGATSYNKTISGLAGPGNVTYSFTCKNSAGVTATGSATVTVAAASAPNTIELFSKDIQALTASNATTKNNYIDLLKHKSCMFDGYFNNSSPNEKDYQYLLKRSKCESMPRAIDTWLKPPDWSFINNKISNTEKYIERKLTYGLFIAEAINTKAVYYDDAGYKFDFSAMCVSGSQDKWWGPGSCVPTTSSSEYLKYLRFIISKGMDVGIQNFLFGQTDYLDSKRLLPNFLTEMNTLAKSKGKTIIFGQQPNSFTSASYLQAFDYINGPVCIEGSNSGCNPIIYSASVLGLKPNAIITELDWWALGDDIHVYTKKTQEERKTWMLKKIIELNKINVGFIKPFLQPLGGGNPDGCYGYNQWVYSPDNQYGCKDEDFINEFLSGVVKI